MFMLVFHNHAVHMCDSLRHFSRFVTDNVDDSYRLKDAELAAIVKDLRPILPPAAEELANRDTSVQEIIDVIVSSGDESDVDVELVKAPAKRTKEQHGNSKRRRKEGGRTEAPSTGNTKTRSYAAATAAATGANPPRTGVCAKCTAEGRFNVVPHKSSTCPYALPDVDQDRIITLSDDGDDAVPLSELF